MGCNFQSSPAWMHGYYARLLPELVSSWRTLFATDFTALIVQAGGAFCVFVLSMNAPNYRLMCIVDECPSYSVCPLNQTVQLAAYGSSDEFPAQRTDDSLPALRDTQMSVLTLQGTGVTVAVDLGAFIYPWWGCMLLQVTH